MFGGAGGYDHGGGYLNSPNMGGTPQQGKGERRTMRAQHIIPCTIAMINKSEQVDEKFMIDGIELSQVVVVGLVRSANETATRLDYLVDDMSGPPIEVRQFVDNDESTPDAERTALVRENIYIRVFGHIRMFSGKRIVVALRVSPLTDINEVTTHMLEVIHTHIYLTKAAKNTATPMDTSFGMEGAQTPIQNGKSLHNMNSAPTMNSAQLDIGLNPQQQQVLNTIRSCMDEEGINISVICNRLKAMPQKVVRDAVEFLSSEGHIYSTVDEEHFKATDSCN